MIYIDFIIALLNFKVYVCLSLCHTIFKGPSQRDLLYVQVSGVLYVTVYLFIFMN